MVKRELGKTGLKTTLIGFGGYHLVEIPTGEVAKLLNAYLDMGGNYIETAADYGNRVSEKKVGSAVFRRRGDFILATKTRRRMKEEARLSLEESLRNLKTDCVDIFFMHAVQTIEEAHEILGPEGAMEASVKAQRDGKIRFIGITGHGQVDTILYSIKQYPYDVMMAGFNYYDKFNYPKTEDIILPESLKRGIGVIGMKALADGYLYRSSTSAIRYTLSLPISTLVLGMNTEKFLRDNIKIVSQFKPLTEKEKEALYLKAPELGDYVCRLCKKCKDDGGFEPYGVFLLEGMYDRQMDDKRVGNPEAYALRERLKFWFSQAERARREYQLLKYSVNPEKDYSYLNKKCPYGIDIDRKLKIAHSKLSDDGYIF